MNFLEAMRKVRDEGKRVRRTDDNSSWIIYKDAAGDYRETLSDIDLFFVISEKQLDSLIDSTWEVVE